MADAPKIRLDVRSVAREHNPISDKEEWRVVFRIQSTRARVQDFSIWIPGKTGDPGEVVQAARDELHRISSALVDTLPPPNPASSDAGQPDTQSAPVRSKREGFLPDTKGWMDR